MRAYPSRRNVAVVLWALAEEDYEASESQIHELIELYRSGRAAAPTITPSPIWTAASFRAKPRRPISQRWDTRRSRTTEDLLSETRFEQLALPSEEREQSHRCSKSASNATIQPERARVRATESDAGTDSAKDEFNVGDRIEGRYEVADVRRGGMGVVYLCYDHEQREPVALKSFQSRFLNNERAVARFVQEAVTWIRLEKHRYIVQARLVQNISGRPYIILEHISGPEGLEPDLRSWIEHKRMTLPLSIEFGLHISLGMQHATRRVPGLVHRDLKPANILVTHDGIAKVTDFGLVRSLDVQETIADLVENLGEVDASERLTRVGAILGTAPYISPEQCRSQDVDVRSDIYSFGCLLYEMLTGQARLSGAQVRGVGQRAPERSARLFGA